MNNKITIVNAETKESITRDMTDKEFLEYQEQQEKVKAERLAKEQAEAEKQAKLESAKAKLTALGLDEAEVQAILGI